jgi:hypothetical protein
MEADLGELTFTAYGGPVETLSLSLQDFSQLLARYPSIEPAMRHAAAAHMAEMAAAGPRGGRKGRQS